MSISVVLACKNSDLNQLSLAINSVLNQTHKDFEFIIVDDGSENSLMGELDIEDDRISIFRLDQSVGLGAALNFGISKSKGKYIARIDDDDLMVFNRLELQYKFMESNPEVVCVGTQLFFKVGNKVIKHRKFPTDNEGIVSDLVDIRFSMAHTSVMFRKDVALEFGGYRIPGGGQDLDLFLQLSLRGNLANLDEYLNYYSLAMNGLSIKYPKKKYEAYTFALNEYMKQCSYPTFIKKIESKILSLRSSSAFGGLKLQGKRVLIIMYVKIFGKTL